MALIKTAVLSNSFPTLVSRSAKHSAGRAIGNYPLICYGPEPCNGWLVDQFGCSFVALLDVSPCKNNLMNCGGTALAVGGTVWMFHHGGHKRRNKGWFTRLGLNVALIPPSESRPIQARPNSVSTIVLLAPVP